MPISRLFAQPDVAQALPNGLAGGAARPLLTGGAYLDGTNGLVLAGLNANDAASPDSAALDITGDIDLRAYVTVQDVTTAAQSIITKWGSPPQASYWFRLETTALRFFWSADGINFLNVTSSSHGLSVGDTKWVRVTLDVDDGSGNRVVTFFLSDDGSSWTQLSQTTTAGTTSIYSGTAQLRIGGVESSSGSRFIGTIKRAIVLDGIGGTTVFDADFAAQTADALAFTESSTNAAPVTINTTRYTYGLPNVQWSTSNATQALTADRVYYQPFLLTAPAIVDGTQFHVTTGPASAADVRTGIYLADSDLQPTGAPILDAGNTAVGTSATGTFFTQVTPVTLQPGMYVTAINTSVAMTLRVQRGGIVGTDIAAGTSSIISLMLGTQTQGAFPNPGTAWDSRTFAATGPNHVLFLRWRAA